jgi:hypothetical protein
MWTYGLDVCKIPSGTSLALAIDAKEGCIMHDPALWASWYIVLLLIPLMILVLMVRDFLFRRAGRH